MTVAPPRTRRPNPTRTRRHAVITDYSTHHTWDDRGERREESSWPRQWHDGPTAGRHRSPDWDREDVVPPREDPEPSRRDPEPPREDPGPSHEDSIAPRGERVRRDRTPPLVLRPVAEDAAVDEVEARNRDHWRGRAREVVDRRRRSRRDPRDWIVHHRWVTVYVDGVPLPDRGEPFRHRRPMTAPDVGRYPVMPPDRPPRRAEPTTGDREPERPLSERPFPGRLLPEGSPPVRPFHGPVTPSSDPAMPSPEPARPPSDRTRQLPAVPPVIDEDDHRPRRSLVRRLLRRVFGDGLIDRPFWWAKTCRTCRVEWPCKRLVDHLHHRRPGLDPRSIDARDADLNRLSSP